MEFLFKIHVVSMVPIYVGLFAQKGNERKSKLLFLFSIHRADQYLGERVVQQSSLVTIVETNLGRLQNMESRVDETNVLRTESSLTPPTLFQYSAYHK